MKWLDDRTIRFLIRDSQAIVAGVLVGVACYSAGFEWWLAIITGGALFSALFESEITQ